MKLRQYNHAKPAQETLLKFKLTMFSISQWQREFHAMFASCLRAGSCCYISCFLASQYSFHRKHNNVAVEPVIYWTELAASRISEKLYFFCSEDLTWKENCRLKSYETIFFIVLRNDETLVGLLCEKH